MRYFIVCIFLYTFAFSNTPSEKIFLQLSWLNQFQSAGFYIAREKGFYAEVGLDVEIAEYSNTTHPIETLAHQTHHYAIGRSSWVIDRINGAPIVALMALFQNSPSVLISTNPDIRHPSDLASRRIMMTMDEASSVPYLGMLLNHGIRTNDIALQAHSFNINDLIEGKTDAMACYVSNEPFTLLKQGIAHTVFHPKDYGFDFYGDILFTSEAEIHSSPDRVKRFYTATKKGWEWAFEHIEESAKILHDMYNTQNKSLEALLFEGEALKSLAFEGNKPFGLIETAKIEAVANIYKLSGYLKNGYSLEGFIDPLCLSKTPVKIGVLSYLNDEIAMDFWKQTVAYLNKTLPLYWFELLPISLESMDEQIKIGAIDFIATNPLKAIQLEHRHGITRIATQSTLYKNKAYAHYGSVVFTHAKNALPLSALVQSKKVGAVDPDSFGGYLLGFHAFPLRTVSFLGSHQAVVHAVLNETLDVGIVRTGVLETMAEKGQIRLEDIHVLTPKTHQNFPFFSSTELFPEWPLSKLAHTSENLSNELLSALLRYTSPSSQTSTSVWKTPQDYSKVHALIKELKLYPYDENDFTLMEVLDKYGYILLALILILAITLVILIHIKQLNRQLLMKTNEIEAFNMTLEQEVQERTRQLHLVNEKLKELANTDELTHIFNRRHFFQLAEQFFYTTKRNATELYILALDIDFFKKVNDTYGHAVGDEILKLFCKTIQHLIRESDIFGRIGGEEFALCLPNTTKEGACTFAEKIRATIEKTHYYGNPDKPLHVTVSIGIAWYQEGDQTIHESIKRSDQALYKAKHNGRNQVQIA